MADNTRSHQPRQSEPLMKRTAALRSVHRTGGIVKVYSMPAIGHRNVTARLRGLAGVE
jgi:hypothetical protein